ncbi:plasmid pRiA4b ORF-3 family protein [Streptomyces rugosispiralis]|uniref:Plasmid pRiA4b ORF-3 family protein n=1 Tax=Streptomyces rugosispiralis TaxID=2967341 RepID=A0ABT1VDS3_9ACTN|nr:plasmid pRiA4b ORF-3 family protein [Streptomyces rugosispiralis]MCQ8194641.1 plasmid pRiA4b ORF-3 family protein [Streptomyces rugosispiralis]
METVHQLRVSMPDIEPVVWRRIHIYSHTTMYGLHAVIQVAMGWDDAHLWEFGARWESYGHNGREASAYTVAQVLPEVGSGAGYVYDFGDHWVHHLEVEKIHRPAPNTRYPRCSAGRRACPPEDCGGPLGYERTLRAIRARKGARYRELREWGLHKYNPAHFDRDEVNRALADPQSVGYSEPAPWQRKVLDLSAYRYPGEPTTGGKGVDHHPAEPEEEPATPEPAAEVVNTLTTEPPPSVTDAVDAVLDALDKVDEARARLGAALRAEQAKTGASANALAERVSGAMSRPLVLRALRQKDGVLANEQQPPGTPQPRAE